MSPLAAIADRVRRFRHSRGFGVHSPFAFRVITEALFPPRGYAYYTENDPRLASEGDSEARRARSIYRLALLLRNFGCGDTRPAFYLQRGEASCFVAAVRLAGARIVTDPAKATCIITRLRKSRVAAATAPAAASVSASAASAGEGLTLSFPELEIFVKHSGMAGVTYYLP